MDTGLVESPTKVREAPSKARKKGAKRLEFLVYEIIQELRLLCNCAVQFN